MTSVKVVAVKRETISQPPPVWVIELCLKIINNNIRIINLVPVKPTTVHQSFSYENCKCDSDDDMCVWKMFLVCGSAHAQCNVNPLPPLTREIFEFVEARATTNGICTIYQIDDLFAHHSLWRRTPTNKKYPFSSLYSPRRRRRRIRSYCWIYVKLYKRYFLYSVREYVIFNNKYTVSKICRAYIWYLSYKFSIYVYIGAAHLCQFINVKHKAEYISGIYYFGGRICVLDFIYKL